MMNGCNKCHKLSAWLLLILGVLFLLQDWNVWNFYGISWYTGLFILFGAIGIVSSCCKTCMALRSGKKRK